MCVLGPSVKAIASSRHGAKLAVSTLAKVPESADRQKFNAIIEDSLNMAYYGARGKKRFRGQTAAVARSGGRRSRYVSTGHDAGNSESGLEQSVRAHQTEWGIDQWLRSHSLRLNQKY